ncbi:RIO-like serine/threonine protein kinase [Encephalitozoon intestinalis ATCC 50506]|uniref:non-specific serine/threonine protein kinase n=1 Tax=Encephalitozoon intestinalis (strain ATCC 50506) TaxID=876142 RepID=E0S909_ENCIT|nr:RIO-like serine/threonine protein kinase [Encephalitozoon intestinalis ATCC 50506]ADM12274.1 RIO-like serine/threonine protein kinase [Encephalitozoon intestinalis ATCC 50506]UTX46081.1 ser/thr protein kinase RIO2 [Encephalitozoon intestinalis]
MKLITDGVWSLSRTHLRILRTAEQCMKSHVVIPFDVLKTRSQIKGNFMEHVIDLCKLKFLSYVENGYKLTYSGHDCLAINTLRSRGLEAMGEKIGIGKESDIYLGVYKGKDSILKLHRLGRSSFRNVRRNREYAGEKTDWLALSRTSCRREVEYLEKFKDMNVPAVLDHDRHAIVQELLDYLPLYKTRVENVKTIFYLMIDFIKDLWKRGYVHGDFNEFNVLVKDDIKVIDFPQCIQSNDERAVSYLRRDFECVLTYFKKKYRYEPENGCSKFMRELGIEDFLDEPETYGTDSEDSSLYSTDEVGSQKEMELLETKMEKTFISDTQSA